MSRQFIEEMLKAKKQKKRCSKSCVIREMQIRAKLMYNFMIVILAKNKKLNNVKCWRWHVHKLLVGAQIDAVLQDSNLTLGYEFNIDKTLKIVLLLGLQYPQVNNYSLTNPQRGIYKFVHTILPELIRKLVTQSCRTLCDPMDCSPPGSSVLGILQARILEWIAISLSRGSSWARNRTQVSSIAGRLFTNWATREIMN